MGRESNKRRRQRQAATAREQAAAARVVQQRTEQRRRARTILLSVVALAVAGVVIAVVALQSSKPNTVAGNRRPASTAVVKAVQSVDFATLQAIGHGSVAALPKKVNDQPLAVANKPDLLFIGAEFCPYCAAERWPLIQALSRFGTFTNLKQVSSSSSDQFANTPSFSFYKSTYRSKYLSFTPIEVEDRSSKRLETPSSTEQALWEHYTGNPPGYPFLDFDGKYVQTTQSFSPGLLAGLTQEHIAAQLNDPSSAIAKAIDGGANVVTATICTMTDNQPANVCLSPAITTLQSELNV